MRRRQGLQGRRAAAQRASSLLLLPGCRDKGFPRSSASATATRTSAAANALHESLSVVGRVDPVDQQTESRSARSPASRRAANLPSFSAGRRGARLPAGRNRLRRKPRRIDTRARALRFRCETDHRDHLVKATGKTGAYGRQAIIDRKGKRLPLCRTSSAQHSRPSSGCCPSTKPAAHAQKPARRPALASSGRERRQRTCPEGPRQRQIPTPRWSGGSKPSAEKKRPPCDRRGLGPQSAAGGGHLACGPVRRGPRICSNCPQQSDRIIQGVLGVVHRLSAPYSAGGGAGSGGSVWAWRPARGRGQDSLGTRQL